MRFKFILFLFLLNSFHLFAQSRHTLSGYVRDEETGENLIGAYVIATRQGDEDQRVPPYAITNEYGFYSMTLPGGNYTVVAAYIEARSVPSQVVLDQNVRLNINLRFSIDLEEIVITTDRPDQNIRGTEMGRLELRTEDIKPVPVLLGELDVLKTIQLLPGVQGAGEGTAGFYVRGGGPDQNLVLLDEAVVFNSGHLFGFFSVFNSDAINNTTLIKGGMPANYGGRLSSVLDISMKEGNNRRYSAQGGIGLIASRLTVEGPIVEEKSSFMVSGRRTYIDILTRPFTRNTRLAGSGYYFYDLNAKANYTFSDKNRLFISGYFGRDVFNFSSAENGFNIDIPWGNATTTLRWNHLFNDKLFMNATAIYNAYQFEVGAGVDDFSFRLFSGIRDWNLKSDFTWYPGANHNVRFGANYIYHTFIPSSLSGRAGDASLGNDEIEKRFAHEAAVYLLDNFDVNHRLGMNLGIRLSGFRQIGPYNYVVPGIPGQQDTVTYGRGETVRNYGGIEPRVNIRYILDTLSSIKASFNMNTQYIHLVSNSGSTLPTDLWVPSTRIVQPQRGMQVAAGYFRNFSNNRYESSAEIYYKTLRNQIEYRQDYLPELTTEIENDFVFGKGESYGLELLLRKNSGLLTGWIGYTLSRTTRQFPDLNQGKQFPARFDRRHDVSVVAIYQLTEKWVFSSTFVYGTGIAITMPERVFFVDGDIYYDYGPVNDFRMPPYHRADVGATYYARRTPRRESSWNFSIYNVYNRLNPFLIYFPYEGDLMDGNLQITPKKIAIFPILPSVTWNFKF